MDGCLCVRVLYGWHIGVRGAPSGGITGGFCCNWGRRTDIRAPSAPRLSPRSTHSPSKAPSSIVGGTRKVRRVSEGPAGHARQAALQVSAVRVCLSVYLSVCLSVSPTGSMSSLAKKATRGRRASCESTNTVVFIRLGAHEWLKKRATEPKNCSQGWGGGGVHGRERIWRACVCVRERERAGSGGVHGRERATRPTVCLRGGSKHRGLDVRARCGVLARRWCTCRASPPFRSRGGPR